MLVSYSFRSAGIQDRFAAKTVAGAPRLGENRRFN
jgi:hypothetical protein